MISVDKKVEMVEEIMLGAMNRFANDNGVTLSNIQLMTRLTNDDDIKYFYCVNGVPKLGLDGHPLDLNFNKDILGVKIDPMMRKKFAKDFFLENIKLEAEEHSLTDQDVLIAIICKIDGDEKLIGVNVIQLSTGNCIKATNLEEVFKKRE